MQPFVLIAALAFASAAAGPVRAATLVELDDFDISFDGADPVTNGFSYQQSVNYASAEALYLHDDGGLTRSMIRAVDGARFDAVEADIRAYSNVFRTGPGAAPEDEAARYNWMRHEQPVFETFGFYGFRDGAVVARFEGVLDDVAFRPFAFGDGFTDLDALEARVLVPDAPSFYEPDLSTPDTLWCLEWCGGLQIDRLALLRPDVPAPAPVPLPPAAGLLLSGVAALAGWRRLGRRA